MPHATDDNDDMMDDVDETSIVQSFINQAGDDGSGFQAAFDQSGKADDAEDYGDISDDDLPEEEEALFPLDEDAGENEVFNRIPELGGLPVQQPQTNGHHSEQNAAEHASSDLFGDNEDSNDLFGEHSSSPDRERAHSSHHARPPPQRQGGLALPTKTSLALPGINTGYRHPHYSQAYGAESMSPSSSVPDEGYSPAESGQSDETDEAGMTLPEIQQRRMLKDAARRQRGETVEETVEEVNPEDFYRLFPRFEKHQYPNFVDFFPPRDLAYVGKKPLKPPRALQATKVSLDILPDQEKSFKAPELANKTVDDTGRENGVIHFNRGHDHNDSEDDLEWSTIDENERIGGLTMQDMAIICGDWSIHSEDEESMSVAQDDMLVGEWAAEERARPNKKRRTGLSSANISYSLQDPQLSFEQPERTTARIAKSVALDLNDPHLLIDETVQDARRRGTLMPGDVRRDGTSSKDIAKRYNISNDEAYDLLKENHHRKTRSTIGNITIEHSLPASRLQYPFYKVNLDIKTKRHFHRPQLDVREPTGKEYRIQKPRYIKRKHLKNREIQSIFATGEDLTLGDNSNVALFEYSEEVPIMMSNFGMGNRLINYYRKRDADDQERPKREIGETHVLMTQDKSPFANFGHVDGGELVPTLQNGMYRAPVFQHMPHPTDFLVGLSSKYGAAPPQRLYLRNVDNLHVVGQQFPLAEVPTRNSRRVTEASKKRLRAISYRILRKSQDPTKSRRKVLNNETIMPHLPGHDLQQTRSKMREFMKYDRAAGKDTAGTWVLTPGDSIPDDETLRAFIKPEEICLLDSMQVGVQHLMDLGLPIDKKEGNEDNNDLDENESIEQQLAPWETTKNFLWACQGKSMLKLHGDGDPTGSGQGFNFVRTSMKGGFQALGESAAAKMEAKKRRETGGHSYNVAKQQKSYDEDIRRIWDKQKESLTSGIEMPDPDATDKQGDDEDVDEPRSAFPNGRGVSATPQSVRATPTGLARPDDDSVSRFSRMSADRGEGVLTIARSTHDAFGNPITTYEKVTNARVIKLYRERKKQKLVEKKGVLELNPGADPETNAIMRRRIDIELERIKRNADRREQREKHKKGGPSASSPLAAGSPAQSDVDAVGQNGTPQKSGRGKTKDGTGRKCANCGQIGHIKTNRKSVKISFRCMFCECTEYKEFTYDIGPKTHGPVPGTTRGRGRGRRGGRSAGRR